MRPGAHVNELFKAVCVVALSALCACASIEAATRSAAPPQPPSPLYAKVSALDAAVFDAFNHCDAPEEFRKHAAYFAPDVEFYHDEGGVTWSRQKMLANTKKNVCGKFRRELVPGTLKVYPVKNFGAIAQGVHRFCRIPSGKCEGMADFTMVWRKRGETWQITRVLSYGHRPNE